MPPASSPTKPAVTLLVAAVIGAALGLIAAISLAVIAVFASARHDLLKEYWVSVYHGLGIGLGVAIGYTFLNWLVSTADRTKNTLGR